MTSGLAMRSRFRRPQAPHTPDFWEKLEAELKRRANEVNPNRARHRVYLTRLARLISRPALQGAMALAMVVLVAATALPRTNGADVFQASIESRRLTTWVPVIEVADPVAPLVMHAISEKNARFVTFVKTGPSDVSPLPPEMVLI